MKIDDIEWSPAGGALVLIVGAQRYVFTRKEGNDQHFQANCVSCGQPFQGYHRQGNPLGLNRRCQFHRQAGLRVHKQRDSFA